MTASPSSTGAVSRKTRDAQRRIFVVLNPIMRLLLRLPWHTPVQDRILLLTYTGRKTGKRYTVPISFVEEEDGSLLAPGGGGWKWGLGRGRQVEVHLRGMTRKALVELITDRETIERLLPRMVAKNPRAEAFIGVPMEADGRPNLAKLTAALQDGFMIVRLRPIDGH